MSAVVLTLAGVLLAVALVSVVQAAGRTRCAALLANLVGAMRIGQDPPDESVVDAARSDIVDRLVDLDVALSLVCAPVRPAWCADDRWWQADQGLQWLRPRFEALEIDHREGVDPRDPRCSAACSSLSGEQWRLRLLDQMVRRVSGGVRGWAPVVLTSRKGRRDLVAFARIRVVLLDIVDALEGGHETDAALARHLQQVLRHFALLLEVDAPVSRPRSELLAPASIVLVTPPDVLLHPSGRVLDEIGRHVERRFKRLRTMKVTLATWSEASSRSTTPATGPITKASQQDPVRARKTAA